MTNLFSASEIPAQTTNNLGLPQLRCFEVKEENITNYKIASDNVSSFIPLSNGFFVSINLKTGEKIWLSELGGEIVSAPLFDDDGKRSVFIATKSFVSNFNSPSDRHSEVSTVRSVDTLTGLTNWQVSVKSAEEIFLHNFKDKIIVVKKNGEANALSKADGREVWQTSFGNSLSAVPSLFGKNLAVAVGNKIVSISMEDGSINFQIETQSSVTSTFLASDENIYWGDDRGVIGYYASAKIKKKPVWKFQSGAAISHIVPAPGAVLAASYDNFVHLLSAGKGKRLWKKRLPGRITIEPVVSGRFVLVTSVGSSEVSVLDSSSGKSLNQISLSDGNFLLSPPIVTGSSVVFMSLKGISAFSSGGCARGL